MSFQAYIDNIQKKTGKTPKDFRILAERKGLLEPGVKTGQIVEWIKKDFGLGHGHAMAIVVTLQSHDRQKSTVAERVAAHFVGKKICWRKPYDGLMAAINRFGKDISIAPTHSYISILRKDRKFAIVQVTSDHFDVGIKLKGLKPTKRFEAAGQWNSMMTHRVRVTDQADIDRVLENVLKQAYSESGR